MWPSRVHYHQAVDCLRSQKVLSYPTESVFGLGCDPNSHDALTRILSLKHRPWQKGLILVAANMKQLEPWVDWSQIDNLEPIKSSWPGPETWVVPARSHVSPLLRGKFDSLAVRVSAHPVVRGLTQAFNSPIVSTSANPAAMVPARTNFQVRRYFGMQIDYYMVGKTDSRSRPSRIREAITGKTLRS